MHASDRSRYRLLGLLSTLLLWQMGVAPTLANGQGEFAAVPEDAKSASSHGIKDEVESRELELFRTVKVSLPKALRIAARLRAGSRVVDISFDGASGSPVYRVKTFKGTSIWEDTIDARTGEAVGRAIESDVRDLPSQDRSNLIGLKAIRLEIADAVPVAERNASGSAISGGLMNDNGKLNFLIVVVSGKELKQVILEPPAGNGPRNPRR